MTNQPYWQAPAPTPRKITTPVAIMIAVLGSVLLVCGIGSCTAMFAPAPEPTATVTRTVTQSPVSPPASSAPASPSPDPAQSESPEPPATPPAEPVKKVGPAPVEIQGDDLVLVGDDIPPGVYRAVERVTPDPWCYWKKSRDAEGSDIIDNDIVKAGRPQVTLKKGQWFETSRCPVWRKQ